MTAAGFVILAGLGVGVAAFRVGAGAAVAVVVGGALGAALLDLGGLLWMAHRVRRRQAAGVPGPVLWLMLRDTFEVSLVVIALVGGLTYMMLATVAFSLHLLPG